MPFHYDKATIRDSDRKEAYRDDQGFLRVWGTVSKPGIHEYRKDDGTVRRELILPDTLKDPEYLRLLSDQVVTKQHPPEPVNSDNAKKYQVGQTNDVIFDNGFQKVAFTITDESTAKDIEDGRRDEISPGYKLDTVHKDSLPDDLVEELTEEWGEFDVVQKNRRPNHVAAVEAARAGKDARFHVDSDDEFAVQEDPVNREDEETGNTVQINADQVPLREVLRAQIAAIGTDEADIVEEVAQNSDIEKETVWGYLTGKVEENPDIDAINAFAEAVGMSAIEILRAAGMGEQIEQLQTQTEDTGDQMSQDEEQAVDAEDVASEEVEQADEEREDKDGEKMDQEGQEGEGGSMAEFLPQEVEELPDPSELSLDEVKPTMERLKKMAKAVEAKKEDYEKQVAEMTGLSMGRSEPAPQAQGMDESDMEEDANEDAEEAQTNTDSREDVIDVQDIITERDELLEVAGKYNVDSKKRRNEEVKKAIAEEFTGERLDDAGEAEIEGYYLAAKNQSDKVNTRKAEQQAASAVGRQDSDEDRMTEEEAQRKYREQKAKRKRTNS